MYHEERKQKFLQGASERTKKVFLETAPFEEEMGKDVCEMSQEELQYIADNALGVLPVTLQERSMVLSNYRTWCAEHGFATSPLEEPLQLDPTNKIRKCMVATPAHLQTELNRYFDPPERETVDCLYRCYFWMAFMGLKEADALEVKTEEVDLEQGVIRRGGKVYELDPMAMPAFRSACTLDSFVYVHPKYKQPIRRGRKESPYLMCGPRTKKIGDTTIRTLIYHHMGATEKGLGLSYLRVWYSGAFYRAYKMEQMGFSPNFDAITLEASKRGKLSQETLRRRVFGMKKNYAGWKKAFPAFLPDGPEHTKR